MEKVCFKCGLFKSVDDFYKHPRMADGHLNKCISCAKNDISKKYFENKIDYRNINKERKRGRLKYRNLYIGTGKSKPENNKRYNTKFPEKRKAIYKSARLIKPFENAEKHHWSYNQEHYIDVIWLSKKDHMKAHRFIIYDQSLMKYRKFDNNELLNTKQEHYDFIINCIKNQED